MPYSELRLAEKRSLPSILSVRRYVSSHKNSYSALSSLCHSLSFGTLICPSLCTLQGVSGPRALAFFRFPDLSLHLCSPVRECTLFARFLSFAILTCSSHCALQDVSAPGSLTCLPSRPDLQYHLRSPGCECLSLACFLSMS